MFNSRVHLCFLFRTFSLTMHSNLHMPYIDETFGANVKRIDRVMLLINMDGRTLDGIV